MSKEIINNITTVLTFLILLSNFALMIGVWLDKAGAPEKAQNERIVAIEAKLHTLETFLGNDNNRIKEIEEGNRVTQKALLALLSHSLNGNDVDKLREAKSSLEEYLIRRQG